jgi:aldehyde dehydrogenase (NAD+)
MMIGGVRRGAVTGEYLEAVNPATGETIARFPRGTADDVDAAVRASREALEEARNVQQDRLSVTGH